MGAPGKRAEWSNQPESPIDSISLPASDKRMACCRVMVTYIDGRFVEDEDANVSVRCRALNYGLGCFGGIRGYLSDDGKEVLVFRLDDHLARLKQSANMLFLAAPSQQEMRDAVLELLRRNEVRHDVYVRPLIFSNSNELSPVLQQQDSAFVVYCLPLRRYIDKESIRVCVSSWRRVADNAIPARAKPTGIYLNSALARREAFDNGFDEAILLTEAGMVSEGSAEHVFLVRSGTVYSPPSTADNLDGITRRTLIALLREDLGLEFIERPIARTELYVADELFLCGTGAEVTPVESVDRRKVGAGEVGPITRQLKQRFEDVVHGRVASHAQWLTPVWG